MSNDPRNTLFAGFAALLTAEIANTDGWKLADVEKLVAQRAYDLALHICEDFGNTYNCYDIWGFSEGYHVLYGYGKMARRRMSNKKRMSHLENMRSCSLSRRGME